ncbi:MAG TPA: gephyrin-like molybdotransferase Glp [Gaiellaceae bacterium]
MSSPPHLLSIEAALALVLAHAQPLDPEPVVTADASGRVLALDARAAVDLPPFDSSAMDGYAVQASDTPGQLTVLGHSAAGRPSEEPLARGAAAVISTGAVVPDGADAVVPVERATLDGSSVTVERVSAGEHVRPRGGDAHAGDVVSHAGTRLGPAQIGALAAAGIATVLCARRPRIALLATGTELRAPGTELRPGEIYESNTILLAAQAVSAGATADVHASVDDDPALTRAALERALAADVVITSGGVSVGPHDLVRAALVELGAEEVFWRVAVRPGKPVAFSTRGRTLVFGLPGNPVSALVGFELFVRPALLALQGASAPGPVYLPARLGTTVRQNANRDELLRARVRMDEHGAIVEPLGGQESHMIARAASADALVLVPSGTGELAAGTPVRYLPI